MTDKIILIGSLVALLPIGLILLNWILYWLGRYIWHRFIVPNVKEQSELWLLYVRACKNKEERLLYCETGGVAFFVIAWLVVYSIVLVKGV